MKSSIMIWVMLVFIMSGLLYHTSTRVQGLEHKLTGLENRLATEKERVHVLKTEWTHLTNPSRIEQLSRKHLTLRPTATTQIARAGAHIDKLPPRRYEAVQVASRNVRTAHPVVASRNALSAVQLAEASFQPTVLPALPDPVRSLIDSLKQMP
jgi:hypothetical protein